MFGALKRGFRSMASLILVRNVVGELQPKRTLAASRGFLAAARLSCFHSNMNSTANDKYLEGSSSDSATVSTASSSRLAHWSAAEAAWP